MSFFVSGYLKPLGFQTISPTVATGLTVPAGASIAVISTTVAANYRDDGVAPTAAAGGGVLLPATTAGLPFVYMGDLTKIQFISATGVLGIAYYQPA